MPYADKFLVCRQCGSKFVFSAREQAFYISRGLAHEPARCPSCRSLRRESPKGWYVHYGPFASFAGKGARQMHPATCSGCGQMTEVPFLPQEGRPVFCRECLQGRRRPRVGQAAPRA